MKISIRCEEEDIMCFVSKNLLSVILLVFASAASSYAGNLESARQYIKNQGAGVQGVIQLEIVLEPGVVKSEIVKQLHGMADRGVSSVVSTGENIVVALDTKSLDALERLEGVKFFNILANAEGLGGNEEYYYQIKRPIPLWTLSKNGEIINASIKGAPLIKHGGLTLLNDIYKLDGIDVIEKAKNSDEVIVFLSNFKNLERNDKVKFKELSFEKSSDNGRRSYLLTIKSPDDFYNALKYQRNSDFEKQKSIINSIFVKIFKDAFKGEKIEFTYLTGTSQSLVLLSDNQLRRLINSNDPRLLDIVYDNFSVSNALN